MTEPILETRHLTFEYPNRTVALDDISMTIPSGRKTVIVGSNGSGKSTLFLHFNGVLRPKSGEVRYEGRRLDYGAKALADLRSKVSVVLQNPDDQIFSTTVEEDVAFGPMNLGLARDEVTRRVEEALFLVDLEAFRERPTQQLSFGERKRVALAGALAMKPKVLMMDEPTAGLDSRLVHELLELADELNQQGLTVIMSTHDVETAYEWADEIRILHQGRLHYSGPPEDFFGQRERVHAMGLTAPLIYDMNRKLRLRRGDAEQPHPRQLEDMFQKMFPANPAGTVRIMPVRERTEEIVLERRPGSTVGVVGTIARRLVMDRGLEVDYLFNAVENAIADMTEGKDVILIVDESLVGLIRKRLETFRQIRPSGPLLLGRSGNES